MTKCVPNVRLNNGIEMPQLGLGVFRAQTGGEAFSAVLEALRLGYRHIDTARIYQNEADVGNAVRESGVAREDVFVTTKLWNDDQGYDQALWAFEASLDRLGFDYVDLYLLHWPVVGKRLDSWKALEHLQSEGRVRAIGVSNFMPRHLEELMAHASVTPAVNQIEVHPFLQRRETRAFCERHGIVVEAYSPLTKGYRLEDRVLTEVAREAGKTPAQVLLRWGIQHGMVVLPKSVRPERLAENAAIFDFILSPEQMQRLDALEEGLATGWDPTNEP